MGYRFAGRTAGMRASAVREMLKLTARPEVVSFGGGLPPNECFPLPEIRDTLERVLAEHGPSALQYSATEGWPALRIAIAERMQRRLGVAVAPERVLVTTGSQQALDLTGKVFLDEGDPVFCESPTYLAAISAFRAYRARVGAVPSDEDGMIVSELRRRLTGGGRGIVYVIPDFQNPSGRTWSLPRRLELVALAAEHDLVVIEDSPYRELRFEGEELPALVSLDRGGHVVFTSTFSKILSPGLRIGWVAAPPAVFEKYVLAKQAVDLHSSTLGQALVAAYMASHDLDAHIAGIREVCRARRDVMLQAIGERLPGELRSNRPRGGLFLWLELPAPLRTRDWLSRCLAHDVAFVPGEAFFPGSGGEQAARLCFSDSPPPRIREGVARMAAALRQLPDASRLAWPKPAAA